VADRSPELVRQALQLLMCLAINPYTRRLHANQHTASGASPRGAHAPGVGELAGAFWANDMGRNAGWGSPRRASARAVCYARICLEIPVPGWRPSGGENGGRAWLGTSSRAGLGPAPRRHRAAFELSPQSGALPRLRRLPERTTPMESAWPDGMVAVAVRDVVLILVPFLSPT